MNFDLSEEQDLFQATVERFAGGMGSAARRTLRAHPGGYDQARWSALAELGLIALGAGERLGGMGGTPIDLVLVGEALGRAIAPDPWLENGMLPLGLLAAANRDDAVAGVIDGASFVAAALAERQARFCLTALQTRAQEREGGFALHGEKTLVLGGALADTFVVSADLGGTLALFVVPGDAGGLDRRAYRIVDGSIACELRLIDVQVPQSARLALDAAGLDRVVADMRLLAAAEMVGLAQRLFDDTLVYVKQREQFGVPIGSFQTLQHRLVDCYAMLEQARSMLYRAALTDRANSAAWCRAAAGARALVGEYAGHIAREAVQMHGGMGVTEELAIGHAMKRVILLATLFGDADTVLADYAVAA